MIGGQTIARIILADTVTILLELPNSDLVILKHSRTAYPKPLRWYIRKTGVRILGIEGTARSVVAPGPKEILTEGDAVIAIGNTEQLKKFIRLL
jgi:Trk K+ transport system NAD-binding subunit